MSNIIDSIRMSGTTYAISDSGGTKVVEITQSDYDNLPTSAKTANIMYVITDAEPFDVSNYYTKAETSGATELATAFAATQPKLSAGTNITIDANNVISAEGGGGKAVSGGTNISITTGETADTINCTLPISATTQYQDSHNLIFLLNRGTLNSNTINNNQSYGNIIAGHNNTLGNNFDQAMYNFVFGDYNGLEGNYQGNHADKNFVVGDHNFFGSLSSGYAVTHTAVFGDYNQPKNHYEYAFGKYNVSNTGSTDADKTLFSVGNGTADNARHNAFEIRQNGDIYITSGNTDIKLQDHLGGGGGGIDSGTVQTMIDQSISGKTNQTDFASHSGNTSIHVTAQDKTNWNNKSDFSGSYNDLTDKPTIPIVPTNVSSFNNDAGYITSNDISGKTNQSDFVSHSGNTTMHVTASEKSTWNNKSDFSGNYNDLSNKPTIPTSASQLTNDSGYITSSALNGYATEAYVTAATNDMATKTWVGQQGYLTQHQDISGKQDVSGMTAYTTTATTNTLSGTVTAHTADTTIHVTAQDKTNWNNKSDFSGSYNDLTNKLSAGTNITIVDNVISAEGGGKAVAAGTNISVTTGTTADTISCKIPYSDVIYAKSDIILGKDMPSVSDYERVYLGKRIAAMANGFFSYSIGIGVPPSTNSSDYNELYGTQSIGIGGFKIGNGSQYSNLVSGCVAIGYGAKTRINNAVAIGKNTEASGTTKTNINNQLTIDTSNQVYISNSANTSTYCLQEKIENTEAALGGLKLVKLSQSEYDSLATKDNSTLYVIVN